MIWTRRDGGRNPKHAAQRTSSLERDAFPTVDCARVRNWGGGAPTPAQATRDPPRRSRLPGRAVDRPLSNMTIGMVLRRMAVPVTVHGFRSTFRVWVEETTNTPVPVSEAALARPKPGDPRVAERFELYACGVELANGFGELTDPEEQRRRFVAEMDVKEQVYGERYPIDEELLAALAMMPPASGVVK
jgi:hypothetical protein